MSNIVHHLQPPARQYRPASEYCANIAHASAALQAKILQHLPPDTAVRADMLQLVAYINGQANEGRAAILAVARRTGIR